MKVNARGEQRMQGKLNLLCEMHPNNYKEKSQKL